MSEPRIVVQQTATPPRFVTRHVAGETIIVPVAASVANLEAVFVLNEVGSRIWELIRTPMDIHALVTTIVGEYAVERDQAETDVLAFVDALASRGLVRDAAG